MKTKPYLSLPEVKRIADAAETEAKANGWADVGPGRSAGTVG